MERLDKSLASQGLGSRKEVHALIKSGRVTVDGEICKKPEQKLDAEKAEICVDGKQIGTDKYIYIMMNKPAGVVCATKDNTDKTVLDILPPEFRRRGLFPAGRLDKDTEGLLIITNDGDFAHKMLSPKKHVDKQYVAELDGEITDSMIKSFENGIVFADGTKCLPAKLERIDKCKAKVTICEGKYHQVKKMFLSCSVKVVHLQRISIGNLYLDSNLPTGSCKKLTKLDKELIFMGKIY